MRLRLIFKEGWLILGLVLAIAISPAVAMRWADWVPGLWVLQVISIIAVLAGFLVSKSRFSTGTAVLLCLIYGLFTVGLFSGLLLEPALPWHEKAIELVSRQVNWLAKAYRIIADSSATAISRDGLIFTMHTGLILWVLGFTAAWYTFRRLNAWRAILPTGVLLLLTHTNYFGPQPMGVVLVGFLLVSILYIISTHYLVREENWQATRVVYNKETRLDFLQAGFLIALLALPLAWVVPNVSAGGGLQDLTQPLDTTWQRVQDGWTQLFASMKSYGGDYADPHGNSLALGGPRQIQPTAVMDVQSNGGSYWRGRVYDTFTGAGWVSTAETKLVVMPDEPLELPGYPMRQPITATITSFLPSTGLLYFPHQPAGTDRQTRYTIFDVRDESADIVDSISRYVIYEGKTYKTWGTISTAPAVALRRAGTNYPNWVRDRYLQLPDDISPRVLELAAAITAPFENPFDKAEALTNWLRANLTYNEAIEAPPEGVDPLEYLLFDLKEGYCNYYATALAVMLRSQGIPARMAAGYTRGAWLEELGVYRVYSDNSHTWVEVFFPGYGWLEFEPTAAQPAIVRIPAEPGSAGQTNETDDNLPEEGPDLAAEEEQIRDLLGEDEQAGSLGADQGSRLGVIIGAVVVTLVAVGIALLVLADRGALSGVSAVALAYDRMNRFAEWLGVQLRPSQTPYERAAVLIGAAPDAAAPIDVVTDLYVEERFGRVEEGLFDEQAMRAWRELRPELLKRSVLRTLSRFQRTSRNSKRRPRL